MSALPDRLRQGSLQLRLRLLAGLTLLVLGWQAWDAYADYAWSKTQTPLVARRAQITEEIIRVDAILTDSVGMAAALAKLYPERRYRQYEAQLERSIAQAVRLDPDASRGDGNVEIAAAHAELVAMEYRVFDLLRSGKAAEARELLSGEPHARVRNRFVEAIDSYSRKVLLDGTALDEKSLDNSFWNGTTSVAVAVLLVLESAFVLRMTRRWQARIVEGSRQLEQKSTELFELNVDLDRKVTERTRELNDSVFATLNMMEDTLRHQQNAEQAYARLKLEELQLEQTHGQLLEASRRAGMAEVATNVLHNVGNVLNSVNVSASLVMENVSSSRAESMVEVVGLLRANAADLGSYIRSDVKGQHVLAFLSQLAQDWVSQRQLVLKELHSLRSNIAHITNIVTVQQTHAKYAGEIETVHVVDLVEDSLRMNEGSLARHQVKVLREFESVPPISVDKHKVLQILVNLMRNAKQACGESGRMDKQMILRVWNDNGSIGIAVTDNGVGIPPEVLTSIFSHGFTTRKDGHGFGLHSGALAAAELGGTLTVYSRGAGQGATFTLTLPATPAGASA